MSTLISGDLRFFTFIAATVDIQLANSKIVPGWLRFFAPSREKANNILLPVAKRFWHAVVSKDGESEGENSLQDSGIKG
jgi:hypothetical protein